MSSFLLIFVQNLNFIVTRLPNLHFSSYSHDLTWTWMKHLLNYQFYFFQQIFLTFQILFSYLNYTFTKFTIFNVFFFVNYRSISTSSSARFLNRRIYQFSQFYSKYFLTNVPHLDLPHNEPYLLLYTLGFQDRPVLFIFE